LLLQVFLRCFELVWLIPLSIKLLFTRFWMRFGYASYIVYINMPQFQVRILFRLAVECEYYMKMQHKRWKTIHLCHLLMRSDIIHTCDLKSNIGCMKVCPNVFGILHWQH
jgi:hypothetical protein